MKEKIEIEKSEYNGFKRLLIKFSYDEEIIKKVRTIPNRKYDSHFKYWHVPYTEESTKLIFQLFNIKIDLKENSSFKEFENYLKSKRYSNKTIRAYMKHISQFFLFLDLKAEEVEIKDIYRYINEKIIKLNYSESYQNQAINSIKGFYKTVYNKQFKLEEIKRPKKSLKLPKLLSKSEIKKLFGSLQNIKHKAVLMLIYSAGLRVSESVNLKLSDINREDMIINIRGAKGKKDRIVNLSSNLLILLQEYYTSYKPKEYLFEGQYHKKYSTRSIQKVFQRAKQKSGINKNATVHSLRHSYATHLMNSGVDLRVIQELLGHKSIKTTEIYTHVTNRTIKNIKSPLDDL